MARKLSLLMAAVAVLALAIPALARAASTTTDAFGHSLPVGSIERWTNIGPKKITSTILGTIECETLTANTELKTNSGGTVTSTSGGEFTAANCINKGNPVTVTSFNVTDTLSTVSGKISESFSSVIDVAGLTCTFTGTSIPGTYSVGGSEITFSKAGTVDGSPAGCGNATLDATTTLEYKEQNGPWRDIVID